MPPLARLNRKIQSKIQVNSIIQKSLRRNGNTGQDFAPLVRKIGGLDSVPAPNPAVGERDKRELPAGHVLLELGGICLFQFLLADPIAQKDVIVIHEHICQFLHQMTSLCSFFTLAPHAVAAELVSEAAGTAREYLR